MQMLVSHEYFSLMMGDQEIGDDLEFFTMKKISATKAQQLLESEQPVAFMPKSCIKRFSWLEKDDRSNSRASDQSR